MSQIMLNFVQKRIKEKMEWLNDWVTNPVRTPHEQSRFSMVLTGMIDSIKQHDKEEADGDDR
jgi:hypothetical protein